MRYARLLSWTLFVVFFLVYLTAIKLVRGNFNHQQQQFIQQVVPLQQSYHPFFGHPIQTQETALLKRARGLTDFVSFEQKIPDQTHGQQAIASSGPFGQQQSHLMTRRQHTVQYPQTTSALHQDQSHHFVPGNTVASQSIDSISTGNSTIYSSD